MKALFRKIAGSIFFLLGLVPLLALVVATLAKQDIRLRMKDKLEKHVLQTIVLPENEVIWMDKHEIWVHESMFDIHTKKLENGVYTFTGLYDEEETEFVNNEKKQGEEDSAKTRLLTRLFHCLQQFFYTPVPEIYSIIEFSNDWPSAGSPSLMEEFREILTPPPQI